MKKYIRFHVLFLAICAIFNTVVEGQSNRIDPAPIYYKKIPFSLASGFYSSDTKQRVDLPVFQSDIVLENTQWLRLHFDDIYLGQNSFLIITSLKDGVRQRLDEMSMKRWKNSTAYFNGNSVNIALYADPRDSDIYFTLKEVSISQYEEVEGGGVK